MGKPLLRLRALPTFEKRTIRSRFAAPGCAGFTFERYFIVNYSNGEIAPNPAASDDDKRRAEVSIRIFGFNENGQPTARMRELGHYENMPAQEREINDFAFRFLFD